MSTKTDRLSPTKKQQRILQCIVRYISLHGYGPAMGEIQHELGFASKNSVVCHLKALERKGCIARDAYIARSIRVLEPFNAL